MISYLRKCLTETTSQLLLAFCFATTDWEVSSRREQAQAGDAGQQSFTRCRPPGVGIIISSSCDGQPSHAYGQRSPALWTAAKGLMRVVTGNGSIDSSFRNVHQGLVSFRIREPIFTFLLPF